MAFQYVIVKNSGRGRGYLPTIMPEASKDFVILFSCVRIRYKKRKPLKTKEMRNMLALLAAVAAGASVLVGYLMDR